jgi:hypothetical protein
MRIFLSLSLVVAVCVPASNTTFADEKGIDTVVPRKQATKGSAKKRQRPIRVYRFPHYMNTPFDEAPVKDSIHDRACRMGKGPRWCFTCSTTSGPPRLLKKIGSSWYCVTTCVPASAVSGGPRFPYKLRYIGGKWRCARIR